MASDLRLHRQKLPHASALPADREACWTVRAALGGRVLEITCSGELLIVSEFLSMPYPYILLHRH